MQLLLILVSQSVLQSRDPCRPKQTHHSFLFLFSPLRRSHFCCGGIFSQSHGILSVSILSPVFWCGPKNGYFLAAVFGHRFWQGGVRPNCLASPLLAKICGQKMATVLGSAVGRPYSEPHNWGRQVVTDCGPNFGLLCVVFWSLVCVRVDFCSQSDGVDF